MNTMRRCCGCQKPLPPEAPDGLCPECLAKAGRGAEVGVELDNQGANARHGSGVKTDADTIGDTNAPAARAEMAHHCRIPGTTLSLVECRYGLNRVNWPHVSLAWILLMLAGASLLGLLAFVADQFEFYIKPETFQLTGIVWVLVAAFALTVAVRQALQAPARESQRHSSQAFAAIGQGRKALTSRVALVVAMMAVVAGLTHCLQTGLNLKGSHIQSPAAVVAVEKKLRSEIQQQLSEAGWKPESLSVSVSPDLKRAECRFDRLRKNGLKREPPWRAAIYLEPQGNGLWQVRGDGEFRSLRFSVDTTAEMADFRDVPSSAIAAETRLLAVSRQDDPPDPLAPQFPRLHDPETGADVPALARHLASAEGTTWRIPPDPHWVEMPVLCLANPHFDQDSLYYAALIAPGSFEFLAGGFALSHNRVGRQQFIPAVPSKNALNPQACFIAALGGMGSDEFNKLKTIHWRPNLSVALGFGAWTDVRKARLEPGDATIIEVPHRQGSLRLNRTASPRQSTSKLQLCVNSGLNQTRQYRVLASLADGRLVRATRASVQMDPPQSFTVIFDYDVDPTAFAEFRIQTRPVQWLDLGTPDFSFCEKRRRPEAATILRP